MSNLIEGGSFSRRDFLKAGTAALLATGLSPVLRPARAVASPLSFCQVDSIDSSPAVDAAAASSSQPQNDSTYLLIYPDYVYDQNPGLADLRNQYMSPYLNAVRGVTTSDQLPTPPLPLWTMKNKLVGDTMYGWLRYPAQGFQSSNPMDWIGHVNSIYVKYNSPDSAGLPEDPGVVFARDLNVDIREFQPYPHQDMYDLINIMLAGTPINSRGTEYDAPYFPTWAHSYVDVGSSLITTQEGKVLGGYEWDTNQADLLGALAVRRAFVGPKSIADPTPDQN